MRSRLCRLPTLALIAAALAGITTPTAPRAFAAETRSTEMERELDRVHRAAADRKGAPDRATIDRRTLSIGRGDTLMDLLTSAAVPRNEASGAIAALRDVYDPRKLKVGQQVTVLFEPRRGGARKFVGLEFVPDPVRSVSIARKGETGFVSTQTEKPVSRQLVAAQGTVRSSLFEAGSAAGVPLSVMMAFIRDFSYDVDFQRDLQPGDGFEILYEKMVTSDGKAVGEGDVLYASLTLSGEEMPIYRHKTRDGRIDYYNRDGESIRRALLRTPIDGARITSGFGMRHHPILGFSKMHQGVDFGAPKGTPIYAAGRGVVEQVGPFGAYGNYIRIRHNTEITTAYAHMSRFAKDMRRGARIDQGDVIGYVGATGRVTGAHLHYEVLKGGRQVNPRSVDLPTGEKLQGRELQAFQQTVRSLDKSFEDARSGLQLARSPGPSEEKGCTKATTC
ncbi:M23 family metallopeptidase [Azospirillum agricola]|uniref:M23 family metallopeptidase n=1 Tax=Azospirillum agricola TaxID=1720247 RepID=UPI000A0EECDE|nr:M23 family metallopeptidase [Azospirillum agricola]SMH56243.1 Murein DD-endopeptidase MepM and murein hydrolase activator NlpD, contain LysM domain [Azospirillum lipoferum]